MDRTQRMKRKETEREDRHRVQKGGGWECAKIERYRRRLRSRAGGAKKKKKIQGGRPRKKPIWRSTNQPVKKRDQSK